MFDPATVADAFAPTGRKRYAVPMLLDLDTHEILYVDVYLDGQPRARVEKDGHDIATLVSAVAGRRNTKMSVAALAMRHVRARGATPVDDPGRHDHLRDGRGLHVRRPPPGEAPRRPALSGRGLD